MRPTRCPTCWPRFASSCPRVSTVPTVLTAGDAAIYRHPILFLHGRRDFRLAAGERQALALYLKRGGFIFANAICASPQFVAAVRRELEAMFPNSAPSPGFPPPIPSSPSGSAVTI